MRKTPTSRQHRRLWAKASYRDKELASLGRYLKGKSFTEEVLTKAILDFNIPCDVLAFESSTVAIFQLRNNLGQLRIDYEELMRG